MTTVLLFANTFAVWFGATLGISLALLVTASLGLWIVGVIRDSSKADG